MTGYASSAIDADTKARYLRDGVVHLPAREQGTFYQDLANPAALTRYRPLIHDTEIADLVAALWDTPDVWFMYEQVFAKSGGATRRTPWHQDTPYLPVRGSHVAVMWMSFEPVAAEHALEFVRGSHRGALYDGSRFDPDDDTAPIYGDGSLPRLPDIESQRDRWPIVSWATAPGDVLVFHPAMLHGGGATTESTSRRTLSLRFFGADAVVAARPNAVVAERADPSPDPAVHPLTRMRRLPDGAPFRDPAFPRVRP
jgi:ectoine hydroxylase-related dioxygenase (phytanoyl-CoA dioxygenase family)